MFWWSVEICRKLRDECVAWLAMVRIDNYECDVADKSMR